VVLENELLYGVTGEVPEGDDFIVPIGQAKILRPGTDVTIVSYSLMAQKSLKAAEEILKAEGIDAEVIDLRSLRPWDKETVLASVRKTNKVVVVAETWPQYGVAAEVAATIMEEAFDDLDAPIARVSALDVPLPYAANLEAGCLPQPDGIAAAVRKVCNKG